MLRIINTGKPLTYHSSIDPNAVFEPGIKSMKHWKPKKKKTKRTRGKLSKNQKRKLSRVMADTILSLVNRPKLIDLFPPVLVNP